MRLRLLPLVVLFALGVSGCMEQSNEVAPRSLGRESSVASAKSVGRPAKPMATSGVPETAEPTSVVTLKQALALALKYNPELKAFSWDVRASEANRLQASLWPNPEFEVEVEEVGGAGERSGFDGAETTIQIAQPIELAQKRAKRTTLAALERDLAKWDYESKRLEVMNRVGRAFVGVLAAQEGLALAEELVNISEQVHATVTQRVEAGKDSPLEQTKSGVALSIIRIEWERAKRTLTAAKRQLAATWGANTASFSEVTGQFDKTLPVPSFGELMGLASQNPDLARWSAEMAQRRAALELEKAKATPDLAVGGGLRRFNETEDSAVVLGLSIPLPVANRNQGAILEATHRLAKAEEERRAAETSVQAALSEAYQSVSSAFIEATTLRNDVLPGAQSAFEAASRGYREGKFDFLSVLDAQRTLFEAKGQYIQSLAAYHKARADVERLIGQGIDTAKTVQRQ